MPEPLARRLTEVGALLLDEGLVRAVAAGRRRGVRPRWRRVELRQVDLKAGRHLQLTAYEDGQAHTRNAPAGEPARQAVEELLAQPFGNWHVETTTEVVQLRVTKRGEAQVHRAKQQVPADSPAEHPHDRHPHDRRKARLLEPTDPIWQALGLADHRGEIKPSRQSKYRQVEEFLRLLDGAIDDGLATGALLPAALARPLKVADLGCGNAYLTFAAFRFLTSVRQLPVQMLGVDVTPRARARNAKIAAELGWSEQLRFVEGSIAEVDVGATPDVVLALHACDTATDEALARAVRWRCPLVLAAPCCHHDLQTQLRLVSAPPPYGLMLRQGILAERFADVLTDALRAALLRLLGYRVEVVQFVGTEHTPRNVLLRAVNTGAAPDPKLRKEYADLTESWAVTPALQRMLGDEVGRVLDS